MSNEYDKGYKAGLQDGRCRFNCRKEKEAFKAGWLDRADDEGGGKWINPTEEERAKIRYKTWKEND